MNYKKKFCLKVYFGKHHLHEHVRSCLRLTIFFEFLKNIIDTNITRDMMKLIMFWIFVESLIYHVIRPILKAQSLHVCWAYPLTYSNLKAWGVLYWFSDFNELNILIFLNSTNIIIIFVITWFELSIII